MTDSLDGFKEAFVFIINCVHAGCFLFHKMCVSFHWMLAKQRYLFIYSFDRDDAVKHSYRLVADVMHIEFIASANSQLLSPVGLFHNFAEQYKILNITKYTSIKKTIRFNHSIIQKYIYMI